MHNELFMDKLAESVLTCGSLATHYQPIVSVRKNAIVGHEALARARDVLGNPVRPDLLFAAARHEGLSLQLDRLCQQSAIAGFIAQEPHGDSILSVNMDAAHFAEHTETPTILAMMDQHGLAAGRLMVEICEDAVRSQRQLENFVSVCRELGILVAIDDLGQKHSNLDRIVSLRPDVLKLDRNLIHDVHNDSTRQNLVRGLVKLAVGGGSLVLAEGTESWEEVLALMELGVDLFQGFYFARPEAQLVPHAMMGGKIDVLGKTFATVRTEGVRRYRQKLGELSVLGSRATQLLGVALRDNHCQALDHAAALFPQCECLYVLNQWGEQISCTRFPFGKRGHPRSRLFEPASEGADHTQRDYFYNLPRWDESAPHGTAGYLTEEYTSMATGNRCRTFSIWFRRPEGEPSILCVDLVER